LNLQYFSSGLRHFVKMYGADDKPKGRTVNTKHRMDASLGNFHANPKNARWSG